MGCVGLLLGGWSTSARAWSPEPWCAEVNQTLFAPICEADAPGTCSLASFALPVVAPPPPAVAPALNALLKDRFQLEEAAELAALGARKDATRLYDKVADTSDNPDLRLEARVASVRMGLARGDIKVLDRLDALLRTYPSLPEAPQLRSDAAALLFARDRSKEAAYAWRDVALRYPETQAGQRAAAIFETLRARAEPRLWTATEAQRLDQLERLVRGASRRAARELLATFVDDGKTRDAERTGRIARAAAFLAKRSWRFGEQRAWERLAEREQGLALRAPTEPETVLRARWLEATHATNARLSKKLLGTSPIRKRSRFQLLRALDVAAFSGLRDPVVKSLAELIRREPRPAQLTRYANATVARLPSTTLSPLLDPWRESQPAAPRPRYFSALKQLASAPAEAQTQLAALVAEAEAATPGTEAAYYGAMAEQRLAAAGLRALAPLVLPGAHPVSEPQALARAYAVDRMLAAPLPSAPVKQARQDAAPVAFELEALIAARGEAYPWLARLDAALRLARPDWARAELREVLMAWREAEGRPLRRMGPAALALGGERPKSRADWRTRRARRDLSATDRAQLSALALKLGDTGAAVALGARELLETAPRPYLSEVNAAAAEFGVDPQLLWAVMRVESVFNPEILSYVSAVGLMQIMPRTGAHIARWLNDADFTPRDLLDPALNLRYSAAYLASLLRRFDGRVPLAIAAYNGGPHNVARWVLEAPPGSELDAVLEHIPFDETRRYVRRVLTHYRKYRQQAGQPMVAFALTLPPIAEDPLGF